MSPRFAGFIALFCAVSVESFAQLSLKIGASGRPRRLALFGGRPDGENGLFCSALFWTTLGILLYCVQIFLWTLVLHRLDVSVAFPMGSLCFVGVALLSKIFLGEAVDPIRWLGVFCILTGTVLMALR